MDAALSDAQPLSAALSIKPPKARLPGEDDWPDTETTRAPTPDARVRMPKVERKRSSKSALMSTVAVLFLVGSAGVMGYAQRAELERIPVVQRMLPAAQHVLGSLHLDRVSHAQGAMVADDKVGTVRPNKTQPQALDGVDDGVVHTPTSAAKSSTAQHLPAQETHAAPQVAVNSPPPQALAPTATKPALVAEPTPNSASDAAKADLAQFDAFHNDAPTANAFTAAPSAPPPSAAAAPHPTSAAPAVKVASVAPGTAAPQEGAGPNSVIPAAKPAPANPASSPAPAHAMASAATASTPPSPVTQAVALTAGPLTSPQQLDVLHLVTELGVLVRDQKTEIVSLRSEVTELSANTKSQLTDFDRRLSMAEAKGAIAAAMGAGETRGTAVASIAATPPVPAPSGRKAAPASYVPAPAPLKHAVSDYHIQAASPDLAMLSVAGGASIQVGVGDDVPGIGQVKSIVQNGTSWQVQTDHGVIK
jgi:hypothetical protein